MSFVTAPGVPQPPSGTGPPPPAGSGPTAPQAPNLTSPDSGLWIGVALLGGILLSGTQVAPLVFGILTVGCIYQAQLMLQGK